MMCLYETMLKCCICDGEYLNKNNLTKHILQHKDPNNLYMYKCVFCDHKSKYLDRLRLHYVTHTNLKVLKCSICNYGCQTKEDLEKNLSFHKDPENFDDSKHSLCDHKTPYPDNLCTSNQNANFISLSTYEYPNSDANHNKKRHSDLSEKVLYNCEQCEFKTKLRSVFKKHKSKHRLVKCDVCDLEMNEFDRKRHNGIFHRESKNDSTKALKCCICNCKYETKGDFAKHLLSHYSTNSCSICKYKTKDELSWISHMLLHSNEDEAKKHHCDLCTFRTADFSSLKRHKEIHKNRSDRKLFNCTHCGAEYTSKPSLNSHMEVHGDGLEMQQCDQCDFKTKLKSSMKRHKLRHQTTKCNFCNLEMNEFDRKRHDAIFHSQSVNDSMKTFTCGLCSCECVGKGELAKHLLIHYSTNICGICKTRAKDELSWLSHMLLHSNEDEAKKHQCDECTFRTVTLSKLKRHKEVHKNHSERNLYKCTYCDAAYTRKASLESHMEDHEGGLEMQYCNQCNYRTKLKPNMRQHKLIHQINKCNFCNLELNEYDLRRHDKIFHAESVNDSMRVLKCCVCSCKFEKKGDLARHLLSHYFTNICNMCNKKTKDKLSWISHMLLHSNQDKENKYHCDLCTFYTSDLSRLKRHKEIHKNRSERNLFKCAHCGAEYTTKVSLALHMIVHRDGLEMPMHCCDQCDYRSHDKYSMRKHKLRHGIQKCSFCNLEMSESDLKIHDEIFHSETANDSNNTLKCCICDCKSETKSDLAKHLLSHKNPNNVCNISGCRSNREVSWISHMLVHSNVDSINNYNCDHCPYVTTHLTNFQRHKDTHKDRSKRNFFKCIPCDANYTTKASLKLHLKIHRDHADYINPSGEVLYNCDYCDYKTKDKSCIRAHKLQHRSVKCRFCNLEAENQLELKKHVEKCHPEILKMFGVCCVCDNGFESKEDLAKHFLLHKDPRNCDLFKCDMCDYNTKYLKYLKLHRKYGNCHQIKNSNEESKTNLQRHSQLEMEVLHSSEPEIPKVMKCGSCNFKTKSRSYLSVHIRTKHPNKLKCCICDGKFITKLDLARHLLLHKDFKSFKCNSCNHTTRYLTHLKLHLHKHKPVRDKRFRCDVCQYEATHISRLRRHKEMHKDPSERKYFGCVHCDCRYITKAALKMHMLRHENPSAVKMFQCGDCDFKTMYKMSLNDHMLHMHTEPAKLKRFKCDFCGLQMKRNHSLKRHIRIFHSGI